MNSLRKNPAISRILTGTLPVLLLLAAFGAGCERTIPFPEFGPAEELEDPICRLQNANDPDHIPAENTVTLHGLVVTAINLRPDLDGNNFFVQNPDGCYGRSAQFSGAYVFDQYAALAPGDLAVGDELSMTATITEYYGLTELEPQSITRTGVGIGGVVAEVVQPADVATGGPLGEAYESVLIRIENVAVIDENIGFGEFLLEGNLRVDDLLFDYTPEAGEVFASITGVLTFSYDDFKLLPRWAGDIVPCLDADGDDYYDDACGGGDCDDTDPAINPDVDEIGGGLCDDGIDQDCDGSDCTLICNDADGDGYGNPASPACTHPESDCDDGNANINPGVNEIGSGLCDDGIDQDCDGSDCHLGDVFTIYQLQNPADPDHPTEGTSVTVAGVIVTAVGPDGFWVEEPAGGEWSGIYIYDIGELAPGGLAIGDELAISGETDEYYDYSQLSNLTSVTRTGTGLTVPGPDIVPACDIGSFGAYSENWEGVLVQVVDPAVTDTNPDAPGDYGEFEVDGCLRVDDLFYEYDPFMGETFDSIAGILNYAFSEWKLEPRDCEDFFPDVCGPGPEIYTIYQLQNTADPGYPGTGVAVTIENAIVTAVSSRGFWIEEPAGGMWSGVYVYDQYTELAPADLAAGDEVTIDGTVIEYYDLTEISPLTSVVRTATGLTVPGPDVVDSCDVGTEGSLKENWEGVLVQVLDPVVTNENPDDPDDFGEFEVDGCLRVDDTLYEYVAVLDEVFTSITGVLTWAFENSKIEPRNDDDLVPETPCWDLDGDGYDDEACGGTDCDDTDPAVNPGAQEGPMGDATCGDGVDNDCDDDVDGTDAGCTTSTLPGDVLIDELYYDVAGVDTGYEYIILYNATGSMIDLDGWRIDWAGSDFTYGTYDIAGATIAAGAQLVIGGNLMTPAPNFVHNFNFQNGGSESDGVRIVDTADNTIDTLIYDSPNTAGLPGDGGLNPYPDAMCAPDVPGGKVLTRDAFHTDTDDCSADFSEGDPLSK